jgi:hypothetical protein
VRQLHDHTDRYRYTFYQQGLHTPTDSRAAHAAILEAARSLSIDLTVTEVARHYASTVIGVIGVLEPTFEPIATRTALKQVSA